MLIWSVKKKSWCLNFIILSTNVDLNQKLIQEIMKMTSVKSKKEVVRLALEEYLRRLKLKELAGLAGKIEWKNK